MIAFSFGGWLKISRIAEFFDYFFNLRKNC